MSAYEHGGDDGGKPRIRFDAAHAVLSLRPETSTSKPTGERSVVMANGAAEVDASCRVEPPHVVDDPDSGFDLEGTAFNLPEPVQVQAHQLAHHLQERRRTVDQRESQLNAQLAVLENELRVSRLWVSERNEEFAQREADLQVKMAEVEARIAGLSTTELDLDRARQQLRREENDKEEELARREALVAQAQRHLAEREQALLARHQQVDEREQSLEKQWGQLQSERTEFEREVAEERERTAVREHAVAERCRELDELAEQQRAKWETQHRLLDERRLALERTRDDILRVHRESVEMRLVAEQLWSQLTIRSRPDELTQAMTELRTQLADEFRFTQRELSEQRTAIESLCGRLEARRGELLQQRDELVSWFERRQQDLSERDRALAERELAMEQERQLMRQRMREWQIERADLQRQIRQFVQQLRPLNWAAA